MRRRTCVIIDGNSLASTTSTPRYATWIAAIAMPTPTNATSTPRPLSEPLVPSRIALTTRPVMCGTSTSWIGVTNVESTPTAVSHGCSAA